MGEFISLTEAKVLGMFHLREEENQEPGKQVLIWREKVEPVILPRIM